MVEAQEECLAEESPLQICINDKPFVITMRTPGNDEALATGLLYSEQIISEEGLQQAVMATTQDNFLDCLLYTSPSPRD